MSTMSVLFNDKRLEAMRTALVLEVGKFDIQGRDALSSNLYQDGFRSILEGFTGDQILDVVTDRVISETAHSALTGIGKITLVDIAVMIITDYYMLIRGLNFGPMSVEQIRPIE